MWKLKIDNREKKLHEQFKSSIKTSYEIVFENLDVGDFQLWKEEICVFLIERKTIADMYASFRDGRYREQKIRFLEFPSEKKAYLIEGNVEDKKHKGKFKDDYLQLMLFRMEFLHKVPVIVQENADKSVEWINQLCNYVVKKQDEFIVEKKENGEKEYTVQMQKKKNMTPLLCLQLYLQQIPGISLKTAKVITEKYCTFEMLMEAAKENNLSTIQISDKKKLGKKNSEKIESYLLFKT
jgi:ERCC4-type nuclease